MRWRGSAAANAMHDGDPLGITSPVDDVRASRRNATMVALDSFATYKCRAAGSSVKKRGFLPCVDSQPMDDKVPSPASTRNAATLLCPRFDT